MWVISATHILPAKHCNAVLSHNQAPCLDIELKFKQNSFSERNEAYKEHS